jgi:ABC-type transport system involved in multi-copper enzyme maturation permease subunit
MGLTILLPVVSILTLTSEWNQRTVLTTFTQESRRTRVINAKVAVSLLLAAGGALFGGLVTAAGLAAAAASGRELDANLSVGVLFGYLLYVVLNVLMGVAFGALLHNSAAAIVLIFALPIGFALLGRISTSIAEWIDSTTTFNWMLTGEASDHLPQILVSAIVWVVVPLAVGLVRTARREIN